MIQTILEEPIDLDGQPVDVGSSIGIAQCPVHGEDPSLLLRRADIAMYVAKRDKSGVAMYESRFDQHRAEHLSLLSDLRRAIAETQLSLHYQPKVDLRRGQVVGVEALIRWLHPERGMIPPSDFILFAEQTGMIRHVTRWVIEEAIRQCGVWLASGTALSVSLNVSSRDLLDRELPQLFAGRDAQARGPTGTDHGRGHRERVDGRSAARAGNDSWPEGAGIPTVHRRLRHRLFLARLHPAPAVRRAQESIAPS